MNSPKVNQYVRSQRFSSSMSTTRARRHVWCFALNTRRRWLPSIRPTRVGMKFPDVTRRSRVSILFHDRQSGRRRIFYRLLRGSRWREFGAFQVRFAPLDRWGFCRRWSGRASSHSRRPSAMCRRIVFPVCWSSIARICLSGWPAGRISGMVRMIPSPASAAVIE